MRPEDVHVDVATEAEYAATVARMLADLGLTYDELAAMAAPDEDALPEEARRVWFAIKPLAG